MRWAALLVTATGCQQLFGLDKPQQVVIDASEPLADSEIDAPPTPCVQRWLDGTATLTPPELVVGINTGAADERNPYLAESSTESELWFTRAGEFHTAQGGASTFDQVAIVPSLNSIHTESKISLNPNRTRAYFASNRNAGSTGGYDIWRGTRTDVSAPWTVDQMNLGSVNTTMNDVDPHISSDSLRLYYAPEATPKRVAVAVRSGSAQMFSDPIPIANINGPGGDDFDPTLTDDERVIVFASNRSGVRDLYYSTRSTSTGQFGQERALDVVNSVTAGEDNVHITKDGCRIYFASDRNGDNDIYTAELINP